MVILIAVSLVLGDDQCAHHSTGTSITSQGQGDCLLHEPQTSWQWSSSSWSYESLCWAKFSCDSHEKNRILQDVVCHSTTAQEITNFQMPRNSRHSALDIPCWFSADPFWMEGVVVCSCWWGAQLSTLHKKTILPIKSKSKTIYCVSYHLIVLNFSDLPTTKNDEFTCSKTWQDKNLLPSFRADSWHQWSPWCIQSQNHHMPKGHEHVHHPMGWSTPVLQVGLVFWWKKTKGRTNHGFQSLPVHPSSHHILRQWVQQANCPGSKAVWFLLEILWLVSKKDIFTCTHFGYHWIISSPFVYYPASQ